MGLDEQRQADAADIGALQIDDLAAVEKGEQRFGRHARRERHHEPLVSTEHVIAELRRQQHERDEERDEVARIDAPSHLPRARERAVLRCGRVCRVAHAVNAAAR